MKSFHLMLVFLSFASHAQGSRPDQNQPPVQITHTILTFSYDNAGNQVKRELCINCPVARKKADESPAADVPEVFELFFPEDEISYYPNPVSEQLYLKWKVAEGNSVVSIQLYSMEGQLLKTHGSLRGEKTEMLQFQEYAAGIYVVILNYSNGEKKNIKIIKK